jgi:N-acetylneuraminate synthase
MNKIEFGERAVGPGEPCYVIAEAGSNHNGDLETAYRLIDAAAKAGADAAKFQLFRARTLYPRSAGGADYLQASKSIYEIIADLEIPDDWIPKLAAHCASRGIDFLCTPFDESAADLIQPFVPAIKIASYEMTHLPLVRHCARKGKPLIVSTGTANLDEVLATVAAIRGVGNESLVLLQCTASYPAPLEAANLRALITLREVTGLPTGLSDHTRDPLVAPIAAVALGASVIEKHFTMSRALPGPDHQYALEPHELEVMVRGIRGAEAALGSGRKEVQAVEHELRQFARRAIFSARAIAAGDTFSAENLVVLRCGRHAEGFPPSAYDDLLGKRAARSIGADQPIRPEDVA